MENKEAGVSHELIFYIKQIPKKESNKGVLQFEDVIYFDLEVIDPEFPPEIYEQEILTRRARKRDALVYAREWKRFEKANKNNKIVQDFLK